MIEVEDYNTNSPQYRDTGWQRMGPSYDAPDHIRSRCHIGLLAWPMTAANIDIGLREEADTRHMSSVGLKNCTLVLEEAGIGYARSLEAEGTDWSYKSLTC